MAQTIKLKRSATAGNTPGLNQLELGEIAINTADGKMFIKRDDGTANDPSIVEVGSTASFLPLSGGSLTGTLQGTRVGLGDTPHATAALRISTTNQHIRLNNGSELGIIELDSDGELNIWAHGDGEVINLRTGSGVGSDIVKIDNTGIDVLGSVVADGLTVDAAQSNFNDSAGSVIAFQKSGSAKAWIANRSYGFHNGNGLAINTTDANPIRFGTNNTERLKIASNGDISFYNDSAAQGLFFDSSTSRLGLGVTAPSTPLAVHSALPTGEALAELRSTANSNATIDLRADGTGDPRIWFDLNGATPFAIGVDNSDGDKFKISGGATLGSNDRLTIDSAGAATFSGDVYAGGETVPHFSSAESITAPTGGFKQNSATIPALYLGNATADGPIISLMDASGTPRGVFSIQDSTAKTLLTTNFGFKVVGNQEISGSVTSTGLTVDGGDVTLSGASSPKIRITDTTNTCILDLRANDSDVLIRATSNHPMFLNTNQQNRIQIASNGDISFYNDSANQGLFFDSSTSRLGLGVTAPSGKLHIKNGASGATYTPDGADQVILENNDSMMMDIRTPSGNSGGILFSDNNARGRGVIQYAHSNDTMYINTAGASALTLDSSQNASFSGSVSSTGATTVNTDSINIGFTAPNGEIKVKNSSGSPAANLDFYTTNTSGTTSLVQRITHDGKAEFAGTVTANAGVVVDNITIDGNEIDVGSGNLTLDVAGNIILDSDAGQVVLADSGSNKGLLKLNGDNLEIKTEISNADMKFNGNDGGSAITALTLDMSDGGSARFSHDLSIVDNGQILLGAGLDGRISSDGTNLNILANNGNLVLDVANEIHLDADSGIIRVRDDGGDIGMFRNESQDFTIRSMVSDKDMLFKGNDGGSTITMVTLDASAAGAATFNSSVTSTGLTANGASEGDTYFTGGTANARLLNVFTSTYGGGANAGHNFKIASGAGAFIFGNNTTANLLTVKTGGIDVSGSVSTDQINSNSFNLRDTANGNMIKAVSGGAVTLYHDENPVVKTDAGGLVVESGMNFNMTGSMMVGATTAPTGRVEIKDTGASNDRLLYLNSGNGIANGQSGPFYGLYADLKPNNSSTAGYGGYLEIDQATSQDTYGLWAQATSISSTTDTIGILGKSVVNSASTNHRSNRGITNGPAAGGYFLADVSGTTNIAQTTALHAKNASAYGSEAYGLFVETSAGPTSITPIRVDHAGSEIFTIASSGNATFSGGVTLNSNLILPETGVIQLGSSWGVRTLYIQGGPTIAAEFNTTTGFKTNVGGFQTAAGGTFTTASGNDLNIVYPDSRSLFIKEGSTTHVSVDNVGNVNIPNGKLGIGFTTAPTSALTVGSGIVNGTAITINSPFTTNNYADLIFSSAGTTTYNARIRATTPGDGTRKLEFLTAKSAAENTVLTLDGDQNATFSGSVQARRARSNTAGEVALSLQPTDSTIHYGFRIDQATNSFNLDRVDSAGQLLRVEASGNATFSGDLSLTSGKILFGTSYNGTIGTASGDLFIGTADSNILFYNGSSVLPANSAGGTRNDAIDLGSSSAKFRYAHFSQSVNADSFSATSTISTGYGLSLTNGSTNYLLYSNTGNDTLYMRDTTNSAMITAWNPTNFTVYKDLSVTGSVTANAGVTVDTINIDGNTIATSSGNFFIDSASDIYLDADGANIFLRDDGVNFGNFNHNGSNLRIDAKETNGNIHLNPDGTGSVNVLSSLMVGSTTAPTHKVHIKSGTATILAESTNAGANASIWFNSNVGGTQANRWEVGTNISAGSSFEVYDRVNGASRMTINSSGNVGINTQSPAATLHTVANAGTTALLVTGAASNNIASLYTSGGSQAMTLTADGNLLVGTTSLNTISATSGTSAHLSSSGSYPHALTRQTSSSGSSVLVLNDTGAGGTIQQFNLDGVTKGNISVSAYGMGFGGGTRSSDFFIKTDGTASFASGVNLGIGCSPLRELDIQASSGWAELALRGASGSAGSVEYYNGSTKLAEIYADTSTNIIFRNSTGGTTESARITSGNEFLIGCTSAGDGGITLDGSPSSNSVPSMELVRDFSGTATMIRFTNIGGSPFVGSITSTTSATAYNTSSDERLKDNIVDAPTASKDIDAIQVRSFDWKADGEHQKYGMVAQELLEVAPDAVTKGDTPDDMMGVDYSKLVPMLIKEIQSLRQRVAQLEE